ncbi:zinc-dependent metalloprotease [Halorhabdus salina]|uniref:zinc-dependent metalloprotease n=1 Tax=Halorhabdus salina TaxID=2750670 RepID=UPI0015EFBFE7|nr:zinc-dependent metalloprotease [Halorhabdus salina]
MDAYRSLQAVASADGDGVVDWSAVVEAATNGTDSGDLSLSSAEREAYAEDVGDARDAIAAAIDRDVTLPETVQIFNRHHWIDANADTFRLITTPLAERTAATPRAATVVNTGTMSVLLGFLARNVIGQYDPLLLAGPDADEHALYFVHPNVTRTAADLDVPLDRFRRWIAFHEVAHAAEFGAAPWLSTYLETRITSAIEELTEGSVDREAYTDLNTAMTAVEGYAELVMDRAFDEPSAELRAKLDERRGGGGPVKRLLRYVFGLGMKRRQYERGKEFFDVVADERGLAGASAVWDRQENLPTDAELDHPQRWLARVEPS